MPALAKQQPETFSHDSETTSETVVDASVLDPRAPWILSDSEAKRLAEIMNSPPPPAAQRMFEWIRDPNRTFPEFHWNEDA